MLSILQCFIMFGLIGYSFYKNTPNIPKKISRDFRRSSLGEDIDRARPAYFDDIPYD